MANDTDLKKRKVPATPKGYDSSESFLKEMREFYDNAINADDHNRRAMVEDIEFTYGEQWDNVVRARREKAGKPVLSKNNLPAYVGQVVNNRLLNETEIRVYPDKGGTKEIAEVRQGIIKSIYKNSMADFARDEANKYQVIGGMGAFHLCLEYAGDDVFEQDIKIKAVADPLAAVKDEMSVDPTGADAERAWVADDLPSKVYKARYPWAAEVDFATAQYVGNVEWFSQDTVKVVMYWRMVEEGTKTLVLLKDGTTHQPKDDTELQLALQAGIVATRPDGSPYVREVPNRFCQGYLCSGNAILEGPYNLPISRVPVFFVPGWELRNGAKVFRWGLVRFLKDSVRLNNYYRSVIAEGLVAAPRNKWVSTKDAISGYEKDWRDSHLSDNPLLIYNSEGTVPQRIPPTPMDAGLLQQAAAAEQDIRDISNIHEATLGQKSNEVSGKAIQERQAMADLGSYHYRDRMRMADEECAKVINELIPTVYDTMRVIVIMGADNKAAEVVLNDPTNPNSDVTIGKYGVSVSTGPSTITKRQLAAEQMMAFVNAVPQSAAGVMDLVAEAQDWPDAQEFARRFRLALPPGVVPADEIPPEIAQMQQAQAQKTAQAEQVQLADLMADIEVKKAEAAERLARAKSLEAQAMAAISNAEARTADVTGKNLERDFEARLRVVETALTAESATTEDKPNDDAD
jgi:hypothetical protein